MGSPGEGVAATRSAGEGIFRGRWAACTLTDALQLRDGRNRPDVPPSVHDPPPHSTRSLNTPGAIAAIIVVGSFAGDRIEDR
jgi:hypothetical protein